MTDQITLLRVGVPGVAGAGVSAAEKATFVTLSGSNVFTSANEFRYSNNAAVIFSSGATTADRTLLIDTLNKEVELRNGADFRMFSDVSTTEVMSIDGATGNMQLDGTLAVDGGVITGERLWWAFEFDGGGSALTTGIKRRWKIPYNAQIVSDGTAAWEIDGGGTSGSIGFDLWMDTYANLPPTSADRISGTIGSQNPRMSSAAKAQSASLTGWTIDLVKGRYLYISIDSITTLTWATMSLHVKKT